MLKMVSKFLASESVFKSCLCLYYRAATGFNQRSLDLPISVKQTKIIPSKEIPTILELANSRKCHLIPNFSKIVSHKGSKAGREKPWNILQSGC